MQNHQILINKCTSPKMCPIQVIRRSTLFSLFAELERDLISLRTKEALAAKKQHGIMLGKSRGTIQKSKFDADQERIKDLLKLGLSVRKIASFLGYKNHLALNIYINNRKLRGPWS